MQSIIEYSHHLLKQTLKPGEIAVDATCGNGHDTLVLSRLVSEKGKVLAFDIQEQAIEATKKRLIKANKKNVSVIKDSHANIDQYIVNNETIGGAIFNLGYLPRSDKKIITKGETTIKALETLLKHLKVNGIIALVVYHGHEGGKKEKKQLLEFVTSLNQEKFKVLRYEYINQRNNPPFVLGIQKIRA